MPNVSKFNPWLNLLEEIRTTELKSENYSSTPSVASLFTQRRNGNCDPQRAQNDIESFF